MLQDVPNGSCVSCDSLKLPSLYPTPAKARPKPLEALNVAAIFPSPFTYPICNKNIKKVNVIRKINTFLVQCFRKLSL